jgi:hypothetical protein
LEIYCSYYNPSEDWVRDRDGRVLAYVTVSAKDNTGRYYSDWFQVGVDDPPPLLLSISGPTSLKRYQTGTFRANPSGGSGTYKDYRWWWRNDAIGGPNPEPWDIKPQYAPPAKWFELTYYRGKNSIKLGRPANFSLKCQVTDSNGRTAKDIHSIYIFGGGFSAQSGIADEETVAPLTPQSFILNDAYPNPFNPSTTIQLGLPEETHLTVTIYAISGQRIVTLADGRYARGYHELKWNGKNQVGQIVSSGIYIYELKAANKRLLKKMIFAK